MALARILPKISTGEPNRPSAVAAMLSAKSGRSGRATALAEAEERGFQRGLSAAREEEQARRDQALAECERLIADERARWLEEKAGRLAEGWKLAFREMEVRLSGTAAALLNPLIGTALATKATAELSAAILDLLAQDAERLIKVTGPEDLITMLGARLGEAAGCVELTVEDRADVRLVAGDTIFETQLEAWKSRLARAIGEAANG